MGRVKIKVNQIFIKQKLKDRELKAKRHQERVKMEIEKKIKEFEAISKNKNHKIFKLKKQEDKLIEADKMFRKEIKYPVGYEQIILESDRSDYTP